jgi:single-strand DNA-binding protein
MPSFNRVILVGNLTRDVEIRYTQSGLAVTDIGLAVSDRRKSQSGEWVEETTFVDVTLWGRTAEVAGEYLNKGSPILIEGRLKLDQWETEGQKRSKLRVVGERMQMLGSKGSGGGGGGAKRPPAPTHDESEYSQPSSIGEPDVGGGPNGPPPDEIPF